MTEKQGERPETEVVAKAKRRQYSAGYKLKLLQEIEGCERKGDIGAILRREGVYSSMLKKWKEQRENGSLEGLAGQKRGPKVAPLAEELASAKRENERLRERLARAELIIDVQKKVSQLLGLPSQPGLAQ